MNTPVLTLQLRETVQNVYNLLVNAPQLHSGFPVVAVADEPLKVKHMFLMTSPIRPTITIIL